MQIQSAIKYWGDQVKKIKFADLHSMGGVVFLCYTHSPTQTFIFSYTESENRNVKACEGSLEVFLFESSFASRDHEVPHDLLFCLRFMFQRFCIISSIEFRLAND